MRIVSIIILLLLSLGISACERNDYQHPLHRSADK